MARSPPLPPRPPLHLPRALLRLLLLPLKGWRISGIALAVSSRHGKSVVSVAAIVSGRDLAMARDVARTVTVTRLTKTGVPRGSLVVAGTRIGMGVTTVGMTVDMRTGPLGDRMGIGTRDTVEGAGTEGTVSVEDGEAAVGEEVAGARMEAGVAIRNDLGAACTCI